MKCGDFNIPELIYGHCINVWFECDEDKYDNIFTKLIIDLYIDDIKESVSRNKLSGAFVIDDVVINWSSIVYVVESYWGDEYESSSVINGVFNTYLQARKCFYNVIQEDYKSNPTHRKALNEDKEYYCIETSDDSYSIFLDGRYNEWNFNVEIKKNKIQYM